MGGAGGASAVRIAVYDAKPHDRKYFEVENGESKFDIRFLPPKLSEETADLSKGCNAVCLFVNDKCDAKILNELAENGVRLVLMRCAGYDRVDLEAAAALRISVARVPAYSPYAVAEFAVGLLLTLNRRIHLSHNRIRNGNFSLTGLDGFDFHQKSVGVVGTGKIGQCFMDIMIGFGCKILAYDMFVNKEYEAKPEVTYVQLDELLVNSDIISLHVPLLESTRYIISKVALSKMKPHTLLVNTSRGGLVDTKSLVESLKAKQIGGAALDVYEEEEGYFFEDRSADVILDDTLARLQNMRNCVVTSHQAFFTREALHAIASTSLANAAEFAAGKEFYGLTNFVPPPPTSVAAKNLQAMKQRGMTIGTERLEVFERARLRKRSSLVQFPDAPHCAKAVDAEEGGA